MYCTDIFENLIYMRQLSDETSEQSDTNGASMVDSSIVVSQLLLASSIPGESLILTSENGLISTESSKISQTYFEFCGGSTITLNQEFIDLKSYTNTSSSSESSTYLDCTVMITPSNLYQLTTAFTTTINTTQYQSDFVLLDVSSSTTITLQSQNYYYNETASTTTSRETTTATTEGTWLSQCNPIILTFNHTNISYFGDIDIVDIYSGADLNHFPSCSFYNTTSKHYEDNGCYLLSFNQFQSKCLCLHTTFFSLSGEEFKPEVNYWGKQSWNTISAKNLVNYPLGWIVCGVWVLVCVGLIFLFRSQLHLRLCVCFNCDKIDDKPLIAQYGNAKYAAKMKRILSNDELKLKYRSLQEIRIIKDSQLKQRSYFIQWLHLFVLNLKNDHLWAGICFRDFGTSYTSTQRIAILCVRLLTTLAVAALFFGRAKESAIGDISLSEFYPYTNTFPLKQNELEMALLFVCVFVYLFVFSKYCVSFIRIINWFCSDAYCPTVA